MRLSTTFAPKFTHTISRRSKFSDSGCLPGFNAGYEVEEQILDIDPGFGPNLT
jgi:hypothetical protein